MPLLSSPPFPFPPQSLSISPPFFLPFISCLSSLFHGVLLSSVNMTERKARGVWLLSVPPLLLSSSHALPADTERKEPGSLQNKNSAAGRWDKTAKKNKRRTRGAFKVSTCKYLHGNRYSTFGIFWTTTGGNHASSQACSSVYKLLLLF